MEDSDCRLNRQNNTFTIRQDLESKIQRGKLLSSCLKSVFDRSRRFKTHLNEKCPDQGTGDLDTSSLFDPHLQQEVEVHQSQSSSWVWDALRQRDSAGTKMEAEPKAMKTLSGRAYQLLRLTDSWCWMWNQNPEPVESSVKWTFRFKKSLIM